MRFPASIMELMLVVMLAGQSCSCTTRFRCDPDASSITLANPAWPVTGAQPERVSKYVPAGERKSGFRITRVDSVNESQMCGNPFIVTVFTLGIVPSSVPSRVDVAMSGQYGGIPRERRYWIAGKRDYSIWNTLFLFGTDDKMIARGLLDAVDKDQQSPGDPSR